MAKWKKKLKKVKKISAVVAKNPIARSALSVATGGQSENAIQMYNMARRMKAKAQEAGISDIQPEMANYARDNLMNDSNMGDFNRYGIQYGY